MQGEGCNEMRSYVPSYEIVAPPTLDQALLIMADEPGVWRPFAGGTDLMVLLEAGKLDHRKFVSIWHLEELRGIHISDNCVSIGALATYTDIQSNPILREEFPMLCRAASETGGLAIQNRGTLGGNIVNASPAADSPPALLVYDAELELLSAKGARRVAYADFHKGYKQMDLQPDELLSSIRLPRGMSGWTQYYRKVGTRKAQAISKICFAAAANVRGRNIDDVRIALGSVAPTVIRSLAAEQALRGRELTNETVDRAVEFLAQDISPIDDIRSTQEYRARVAGNLLKDFLSKAQSDRN
jgi:CO/xanthine dehydrogenase FAD-binding subunit